MKQLTAKNGEKEWQYEGKTLIAIEDETPWLCKECFFYERPDDCPLTNKNEIPSCVNDFDEWEATTIFIEKPAEQ